MSHQPDDAVLRGYVSGQRLYQLIEQEAAKSPDARDLERFSQSFGKLESVAFSAGSRGRRSRPSRPRTRARVSR